MKVEIENRLRSLTSEFKSGQEMLAELDSRRTNLHTTLTRITGAIQVLQELLQQNQPEKQESDSLSKTSMVA